MLPLIILLALKTTFLPTILQISQVNKMYYI